MGRLGRIAALGCLALLMAASDAFDPERVMEESQSAVGGQVSAYTLVDRHGRPLRLARLRGTPLVVSIVYTSCGSVCPPTTQRVIDAVAEARGLFGAAEFGVLTLGFDGRGDTPGRLDAFAKTQRIPQDGWHVASADEATLRRLLDDLGFSFRAAAGGYEHITQTTILDADHRVHAQVYGEYFPDPVFIEPLKELIWGTRLADLSASGLLERLRYICTTYSAADRAYRFDYAILFGIAIGGLSLLLSGWVVVRLWLVNRRLERGP